MVQWIVVGVGAALLLNGGSGAGIYNYRAEADRILTDMVHRAVVTGPTSRGPRTAGPMFNVEHAGKFIEALWNTPIPSGRYRYYDGMLYLMSMLHCSGQFRIWPPPEPASVTKRDGRRPPERNGSE